MVEKRTCLNQTLNGGSKNPSNLPNLGETSAAGMVSIMWYGRRMESNEVVELEEWEEAVALIMMDALDVFGPAWNVQLRCDGTIWHDAFTNIDDPFTDVKMSFPWL